MQDWRKGALPGQRTSKRDRLNVYVAWSPWLSHQLKITVLIPSLVNANLISRVSGTEDGTLRSKQCVKTMSASHVVQNGLKHDHLGAEGMGMAQMTFRFFTALLHKGNLIPLMCHDRRRGGR